MTAPTAYHSGSCIAWCASHNRPCKCLTCAHDRLPSRGAFRPGKACCFRKDHSPEGECPIEWRDDYEEERR